MTILFQIAIFFSSVYIFSAASFTNEIKVASSDSPYSGSGAATYYYDISGPGCFGEIYPENHGYPECTSHNPDYWKTLAQYGTNNIVAIDNTKLNTPEQRAALCGKKIRIFYQGKEVIGPNGNPFVVFDGCEACIGGGRVDFSVPGIELINGNACTLGVVPGISWEVTDEQVIPFIP